MTREDLLEEIFTWADGLPQPLWFSTDKRYMQKHAKSSFFLVECALKLRDLDRQRKEQS